MRDVQKAFDSDSGPNYILDLDGPDGNVYYLWGLLKNLLGEETIEESKNAGHYTDPSKCPFEGYERVLDYCLHHLQGDPHGISFQMFGNEISQIEDYRHALRYDREYRGV